MQQEEYRIYRRRRLFALLILAAILIITTLAVYGLERRVTDSSQPSVLSDTAIVGQGTSAAEALETLVVKGRAPKTGYERELFGEGWGRLGICDARNVILKRDLTAVVTQEDNECIVLSGTLEDPYTGTRLSFVRGPDSSAQVQIDHVVALSDAWQKGAQGFDEAKRLLFANDPLNLLAVDGKTNMDKGDSDAASWLPPNSAYRCRYVARQIAVKQKYLLWVTAAEKEAMKRVLKTCPGQVLPIIGEIARA